MSKLVILIESQLDWLNFERRWPDFLKIAEQMPGLLRETSSPVHHKIHGNFSVGFIHELYFESMSALRTAMSSPQGRQAGEILQDITDGKVTLLFADHLEDELANIEAHKLTKPPTDGPPGDKA